MKQEKCRKSEVQLPKLAKNPKLYYCFSYRDREPWGQRYLSHSSRHTQVPVPATTRIIYLESPTP